jgi:hypothetical protein
MKLSQSEKKLIKINFVHTKNNQTIITKNLIITTDTGIVKNIKFK